MTNPLTFHAYDEAAAKTAIYPDAGQGTITALAYVTLGLTNEAGEVAGKLKKIMRDEDGYLSPAAKVKIADEAADTLWYLSRVARECGTTLQELANANVSKLADRMERGAIKGSGDNR